uniref:LrgA n=1 Tax=uncultured organism TaxID=155900 RepID=M1Q1Q5_9ZZZZ|nr:LrgA [uncultured organism]
MEIMYKGIMIIFGFYFLGEVIVKFLNIPVPGNVLGMVLIVFSLSLGIINLEDVEKEAEFLVENMSVLFIPPGVGIILYWSLMKTQIVPILGALFISFLVTITITGKLVEVSR